jgi:hypothetical protein
MAIKLYCEDVPQEGAISCKDARIDREGNGTNEIGTLFCIMQTSPYL